VPKEKKTSKGYLGVITEKTSSTGGGGKAQIKATRERQGGRRKKM